MTDLSNILLAICSGCGASVLAGLAWMVFSLIKNSTAIEHLEKHFDERFEQVEKRFEQVDKRFEQVDKRFEQMDKRFDQLERNFQRLEDKFDHLIIALANNLGVQNAQPKVSKKPPAARLSDRPKNI